MQSIIIDEGSTNSDLSNTLFLPRGSALWHCKETVTLLLVQSTILYQGRDMKQGVSIIKNRIGEAQRVFPQSCFAMPCTVFSCPCTGVPFVHLSFEQFILSILV